MDEGYIYGLPSGQDVARTMGIAPLSNKEIGLPESHLSRNPKFTPTVEQEGEFTMGDFLQFAGVVEDPAPAPDAAG